MPITLSKIKYGTRSIVHFEALEQTVRLRLVPGPADKKFFLIIGSAPTPTVGFQFQAVSVGVFGQVGGCADLMTGAAAADFAPT
jgi:hypothetical protein